MSIEEILPGLNNPNPQTRQETIRELVKQRAFSTVEILRQIAARDPDADVRTLAAGAIDFFERQAASEAIRRGRGSSLPDLSDQAIEQKMETIRQNQISLGEYVVLGIIGFAIVVIFIFLVYNGLRALFEGERIDAAPERPRAEIIAEMRQHSQLAREAAELLQQLPALINEGGFNCADLTDIPPVYALSEATRKANPDLVDAQEPLNNAHNWINDVEERWRRFCQENGGRLTQAPDYLVNTGKELLAAGLDALDEADKAMEALQ